MSMVFVTTLMQKHSFCQLASCTLPHNSVNSSALEACHITSTYLCVCSSALQKLKAFVCILFQEEQLHTVRLIQAVSRTPACVHGGIHIPLV